MNKRAIAERFASDTNQVVPVSYGKVNYGRFKKEPVVQEVVTLSISTLLEALRSQVVNPETDEDKAVESQNPPPRT